MTSLPHVAAEWVVILLRIREVVGSDAGLETAYPKKLLRGSSQTSQENWDSSVGIQTRQRAPQAMNWNSIRG
jgi:hypothetical protein